MVYLNLILAALFSDLNWWSKTNKGSCSPLFDQFWTAWINPCSGVLEGDSHSSIYGTCHRVLGRA